MTGKYIPHILQTIKSNVLSMSTSISEGEHKKHSSNVEDAPHLRNRGEYKWSNKVPRIYCPQTIWADTAFHAIHDFRREDLIKYFNLHHLRASIVYADTDLFKYISGEINQNSSAIIRTADFLNLYIHLISETVRRFILFKCFNRLLHIMKIRKITILSNLGDIGEATVSLMQYLKSNNFNINKVLRD